MNNFRLAYAVTLGFFIIVLIIQGLLFYLDNQDLPGLSVKIKSLHNQNDEKRIAIKKLEDKIYLLENDYSVLEEKARSDYLMKKKDEVLYQYVES